MLHPMTCHRPILVPCCSSEPFRCLSGCAHRAVARREDLRKDGSFDLRNIVEAYIRFGILVR